MNLPQGGVAGFVSPNGIGYGILSLAISATVLARRDVTS